MLLNLLFPTARLLLSFLFLFHALVLLLAPDRYIPTLKGNLYTIKLVRRRAIQFGKRFAGFFLTAIILWAYTVPAVEKIFRLVTVQGFSGDGNVFVGDPIRWGLLAVSIGAVLIGYFMFMWPDKWVKELFRNDMEKLQDPATRKLWTLYIQLVGVCCSVFSLVIFVSLVRRVQ
jgi:hypothetical protein